MSMFANAKTVAAKPKGKAASKKVEVETAGLQDLAALEAAIKALTALAATTKAQINEQQLDYFVTNGCATKTRPESYKGVDGSASASLELRARAANRPLSPDEIELLTEKAIPLETVEVTVEAFIINPVYAEDGKTLGQIEKALKSVKGIPDDLFLKQEGVSKTILAEGGIDKVFLHDEDTARDLLGICGVLAVKPVLATDDINEALAIVQKMIAPKGKAKAAKAA